MSIYDYEVTLEDGSQYALSKYKGRPMLIVNTATKCGFAPQFEQKTVAACRHLQLTTDEAVKDAKDIADHLTAANEQMATIAMANSNELLGQMVAAAAPKMKLQFTLHD